MDDGRFLTIMEEVGRDRRPAGGIHGRPVLAEWRAAERRLAAIPRVRGVADRQSGRSTSFRRRYHALFDQRGGAA